MKVSIFIFAIGISFLLTDSITLEDLRWKKRIVLVFAEGEVVDYSDSLKIEMEDRDIVYFVFSDSLLSNTDFSFDEEYVQQLKTRYLLGSQPPCWVLLGKDGSLKLRKEEKVDWEVAFALIDSAPTTVELVSW